MPTSPDEPQRGNLATAAVLFVAVVAVYFANGDFVLCGDATANLHIPLSLLAEGNLSFTPQEYPFLFNWQLETPQGVTDATFTRWDDTLMGVPASVLYQTNRLVPQDSGYIAVPTTREGVYASFFGVGAGLSFLPFACGLLLFSSAPAMSPALYYLGKCAATLFIAGSVVCVFLSARFFLTRRNALFLSIAYALGTSVWSVSSQTLWQHAPNTFFLTLGVYFLLKVPQAKRYAVYTALALGWAVWCRPTSAVVAASVGVYLLITDRKAFWPYPITGLPFAIGLAAYNTYYLGSPLRFGQTVTAPQLAMDKTGSPEVWQTPLFTGLAGLLFSPSRGLFLYSPVLIFAVWGGWRLWTSKRYIPLRPLFVAMLLVLCVEAKHFDWWGGFSFGYRHIVDLCPFLALAIIPVMDTVIRRRRLLGVFVCLLAWSVAVQVVGAFAYNGVSWNGRPAIAVQVPDEPEPVYVFDDKEAEQLAEAKGGEVLGLQMLNIDAPMFRHRLWSLCDSQLLYHFQHFREARALRKARFETWLESPQPW